MTHGKRNWVLVLVCAFSKKLKILKRVLLYLCELEHCLADESIIISNHDIL